jgi:hypothetical protein
VRVGRLPPFGLALSLVAAAGCTSSLVRLVEDVGALGDPGIGGGVRDDQSAGAMIRRPRM